MQALRVPAPCVCVEAPLCSQHKAAAEIIRQAIIAERGRCAGVIRRLPDTRVYSNMWISVGGTVVEGAISRQDAVRAILADPAQPDVGRPTTEESTPTPLTAKRTP